MLSQEPFPPAESSPLCSPFHFFSEPAARDSIFSGLQAEALPRAFITALQALHLPFRRVLLPVFPPDLSHLAQRLARLRGRRSLPLKARQGIPISLLPQFPFCQF